MKKLLIATSNPAKLEEYKVILKKDLSLKLVSLKDLGIEKTPKETGKTFKENATKKAKFYCKLTKLPTLADDAGLEIDYLNGEPGVNSRRWPGYEASDEELMNFTLKKMKEVPLEKRGAQMTAALALSIPDQKILIFEEKIRGIISEEPKGKLIPGFPFRPIFYLPEFGKNFAELSFEEEAKISPRRKIIEKIIPVLKSKMHNL